MPRKAEVDRPVKLNLKLPETIRGRLDLELWSELEGRVPQGKYQEFFVARLHEYWNSKVLNLAPFGFPDAFVVRGPKEVIEALEKFLKGENAKQG